MTQFEAPTSRPSPRGRTELLVGLWLLTAVDLALLFFAAPDSNALVRAIVLSDTGLQALGLAAAYWIGGARVIAQAYVALSSVMGALLVALCLWACLVAMGFFGLIVPGVMLMLILAWTILRAIAVIRTVTVIVNPKRE